MDNIRCDYIECNNLASHYLRLKQVIGPLLGSLTSSLLNTDVTTKICKYHKGLIQLKYETARERSIVREQFYDPKKLFEKIPFIIDKGPHHLLECQRCFCQWAPTSFDPNQSYYGKLPSKCKYGNHSSWQNVKRREASINKGNFRKKL